MEEKSQKQEEAPGLIWFQCRGDLPPGNLIFESVALGAPIKTVTSYFFRPLRQGVAWPVDVAGGSEGVGEGVCHVQGD